jgi:hypothetical protein
LPLLLLSISFMSTTISTSTFPAATIPTHEPADSHTTRAPRLPRVSPVGAPKRDAGDVPTGV